MSIKSCRRSCLEICRNSLANFRPWSCFSRSCDVGVQSTDERTHRPGGWLPHDQHLMQKWLDKLIQQCSSQEKRPLDPVLQAFKDVVDADPVIRMFATAMFEEVPTMPPYNKDPIGSPQVKDYNHMFQLINVILSEGPPWYHDPDDLVANGMIGFPITAILEWPMGTSSGFAFFTNPIVNTHFKAVLNRWHSFLSSGASRGVLNCRDGWTSKTALEELTKAGNCGVDHHSFPQLYACSEPSNKDGFGFRSWEDFFLREFKQGIRPIYAPDDGQSNITEGPFSRMYSSRAIVHACEATPYRRSENVQLRDSFWLKGQPYSLCDILNGETKARPFVGGQIYQAFLSALSYHRWHAPISGHVESIEILEGTYYSENFYQGFNASQGLPDPLGPNDSQGYIAQVATRGIIRIEADDPQIGLMAAVFIGMCEASSIEFFVKPGGRVNKGQQIGTFHFGGSSYCLVFRPETHLFFIDPGPYSNVKYNSKVNSLLAIVQ